jgi:predicted Ser/Thr protein kinase
MTATIIDFPIASMTPRNLTSSMAGYLLEAVAVEEMQS